MNRSLQPALTLFAVGMIGLGILALIYGDFALVWQPVAAWVPARTALAYLSGAIMLLGGIGALYPATRAWSLRVLVPYLILWVLLKVPALFVAPSMEAVWLGVGELIVLMIGGWILYVRLVGVPEGSWLNFATSKRAIRIARIAFGLSLIPIGLSHIVYLKQTVDFVPAWLPPNREFWAYLTGVGQIASGLGIVFSVLPRAAAWAEAGQISLYALLVWVPAIMAAPSKRLPWTAFFISWAIASGAWAVAQDMATEAEASGVAVSRRVENVGI
jgi:uncharacterized membrane protein